MTYRQAAPEDCALLAVWNQQLIRDEGNVNPMSLAELEKRMHGWLAGEYRAIIFEEVGVFVAYALYVVYPDEVFLRQFFVSPERRRQGLGRRAMRVLQEHVWPKNRRLTVDVLTANKAGMAFWRAVGYKDYALTLEMLPRTEGVD